MVQDKIDKLTDKVANSVNFNQNKKALLKQQLANAFMRKRTKSSMDLNKLMKQASNINSEDLRKQTTSLSVAAAVKTLMTLSHQSNSYSPDRKINRKEVFKRIFMGEKLTHEEMFRSRGFRGLNILPFTANVKDQIEKGIITIGDARKFCRQSDGHVDYTNYVKINNEHARRLQTEEDSASLSGSDHAIPSNA